MTKKHFIALADMVRREHPDKREFYNVCDMDIAMAIWERMRDALADYCQSQNARFNRECWLGYIAGIYTHSAIWQGYRRGRALPQPDRSA